MFCSQVKCAFALSFFQCINIRCHTMRPLCNKAVNYSNVRRELFRLFVFVRYLPRISRFISIFRAIYFLENFLVWPQVPCFCWALHNIDLSRTWAWNFPSVHKFNKINKQVFCRNENVRIAKLFMGHKNSINNIQLRGRLTLDLFAKGT